MPEKYNNSFKLMGFGVIGLLVLSAMTLTGIALTEQYSKTLRSTSSANATGIDLPLTNNTVLVGTTGQYPFLQTATNCYNTSTGLLLGANNYTVVEGDADGGFLLLGQDPSVEEWNVHCAITYLADSDAQASADFFKTSLGVFGLFAALLAIATIGIVIIQLFSKS